MTYLNRIPLPLPEPGRLRHGRELPLVIFFLFCTLAPHCCAQRKSGAAAITLNATLSQSLTMSAAPNGVQAGGSSELLAEPAAGAGPSVTITTNWVGGPGKVTVEAFSSANPLLGPAGRAMILLGAASPIHASPALPASEGFLPSARKATNTGLPGLRIDTKDLEIPRGSESGALTIRAEAL
jgi:hypothetical protein